jgi:hypothetical protein
MIPNGYPVDTFWGLPKHYVIWNVHPVQILYKATSKYTTNYLVLLAMFEIDKATSKCTTNSLVLLAMFEIDSLSIVIEEGIYVSSRFCYHASLLLLFPTLPDQKVL